MRRYNYIILGSHWDLYRQSYSDLDNVDDADYVSDAFFSSGFLRRIHFSPRLNKFFKLPFKSIWKSRVFNHNFDNEKPLCFILFSHWAELDDEVAFVEFLRNKYKESKFVLFFQDLYKYYSHVNINKYDLILSFDYGDVQHYGFVYHPLVFSSFKSTSPIGPKSDIYFLGKAKDRFTEIIEAYEVLRSHNLKVDFNLVGVDKQSEMYSDDISYIDKMTYKENLEHILNTKCVLEIMQHGGLGFTQRVVEVVGLNRKLLTNNAMIKNAPFYNPQYISQFSMTNTIDGDFLESLKTDEVVDYNYQDQLSPIELIDFIDARL